MAQRARLFIALLRRRAERILAAHRAPPPPVVSVSAGLSHGYESNVNLDGARKGDYFFEESASVLYRPKITSWLAADFSANLLNNHFMEFTDNNLWTNTFAGGFEIQPHRILRLDLGMEYAILNFPRDRNSSFFDRRTKAALSVAQTSWLTHKAGWIYQEREYDNRTARDSSQNAVVGLSQEDKRHTGFYELQLKFPKTRVRLGGQFYRNFSNDQFQESYDWDDIQFRGSLLQLFGEKWVASVSVSQERKNYGGRPVPAINVSERDDLFTAAGSVIYQLNAPVSLSYSLTYRHQDSNDPRVDFTDWIHQVGVTVNF